MSSEQEIAAAEEALRQAEADLQKLLSQTINNGVMLESPSRGLELKRLRDAVAEAKRRLATLKAQ
jgi:hypothetical protein